MYEKLVYQSRINIRNVQQFLIDLVNLFVSHSSLFVIGMSEIQKHVLGQQTTRGLFEHIRSVFAEGFRCVYVAFFCEDFRAEIQEVGGLVPHCWMVSQTEQTLFDRKNHSFRYQRCVFCS